MAAPRCKTCKTREKVLHTQYGPLCDGCWEKRGNVVAPKKIDKQYRERMEALGQLQIPGTTEGDTK